MAVKVDLDWTFLCDGVRHLPRRGEWSHPSQIHDALYVKAACGIHAWLVKGAWSLHLVSCVGCMAAVNDNDADDDVHIIDDE